jgi:hypothetical protein
MPSNVTESYYERLSKPTNRRGRLGEADSGLRIVDRNHKDPVPPGTINARGLTEYRMATTYGENETAEKEFYSLMYRQIRLEWKTDRAPEGAAKLAANPAGEEPASRTCPVATVVIPDGGESDLSCRKLRSKSPSRQSVSSVGSVKGANKSAGCSERSEPLAAKSRSHG